MSEAIIFGFTDGLFEAVLPTLEQPTIPSKPPVIAPQSKRLPLIFLIFIRAILFFICFLEVKSPGLHDYELTVGNLGEARLIEAEVRLDHLRRQAPQPLVKRDVLENVRGEHLQEDRVGVAGVLDIMRAFEGT